MIESKDNDGTVQAVVLTEQEVTDLGDGVIGVSAVATDTTGNISPVASTEFQLDLSAPTAAVVITDISEDSGSRTMTSLPMTQACKSTGSVDGLAPGDIVEVSSNNGSSWSTADITINGDNWTFTDPVSRVDGTVTYRMRRNTNTTKIGNSDFQTVTIDTRIAKPILTLGEGVGDAATAMEATQDSGVVTVQAEDGATVEVTFTNDINNTEVIKTMTADGTAQPVVLNESENGELTILGDGEISVSAVATDVAGNIKSAADISFELRADAPNAVVALNRL